jgi:hypothetical protein
MARLTLTLRHGDLIHPVCYWSRKMTSAERGYAIYDKELLALVSMVNKHSHLLRGVPFTANQMRVADWLTRNPAMHTLCTKCSGPVELKALISPDTTSFIDQVIAGYTTDLFSKKLQAWQQSPQLLDRTSLALFHRFSQSQGLWYYNDSKVLQNQPVFRVRLYTRVLRTALLQRYHESLVSGHQAAERTTRQMEI